MSRKIIQVVSKYTTKDGTSKNKYTTVGSAFVYDDGSISLMIDPGIAISCSEGIKVYVRDPLEPKSFNRPDPTPKASRGPDEDDYIPF